MNGEGKQKKCEYVIFSKQIIQRHTDKKTHDHVVVSVNDILNVNDRIQKKYETEEIMPFHFQKLHYFPEININQVKRSGKNQFDQEINHNFVSKT